MLSLVYSGTIRSSGFNFDPAQIGFIAPIVAAYGTMKKKYWLLAIALGSILASASTTGIVTTIILFIVALKRSGNSKNNKKIITTVIVIVLFFLLLFSFREIIAQTIGTAFSNLLDRISRLYLENGMDGNVRMKYILCFPRALIEVVPFAIFGSGFGTSSLGYSISPYASELIGSRVHSAYDIENNYIAYFFDTGIVGVILFANMILLLLRSFKKKIAKIENKTDIVIYFTVLSLVVSTVV